MIENVTAESIVAHAIQTEEIGAEVYRRLARQLAGDPDLRELFEALARDEVEHAEQIRALGERLSPRLGGRAPSAEERDYLRATSSWHPFSGPDGPLGRAEGIQGRDDALRLALHLEKATLAYYQAVRDVVGPEPILDALVSTERRHVVAVTARLVSASLLRGLAESA